MVRRWQRWFVFALAVAVLGVAAAWWGWARVVPAHRPALQAGERFGVDVSNHQGAIDWRRVAADDMDFAYIKATEGGDFVDPWFTRNWEGAGAAGLERGAYHFFTLCRPGADQARNFLRVLPREPDSLPPALDLELGGNCAQRPDPEVIRREVAAFLDAVEAATGRTVAIYLLDDFAAEYPLGDVVGDRPQWARHILRRPPHDDWWIWQVQGWAAVDGIDGQADLNVMRPDPSDP